MRSIFLAAALVLTLSPALAADITVFAAASLKGPLDQAAQLWEAQTGNRVTLAYGGSSALARQIEEAAPADVFISAAETWMDRLAEGHLIAPDSRRDLFGNSLVLIAADPQARPVPLAPDADLAGLLAGGKLAMALVDSVPAGQYGKEALTALGFWDKVAPEVVQAEDVKAAARLVTSGEAAYGIVYATDATGITVVATFPEDSHRPILYPGAAVSTKPEARAFLDFLQTPGAGRLFADAGFRLLP